MRASSDYVVYLIRWLRRAATPSTEEQRLGQGALSPRSDVAEGPTPQRKAASSLPAPAVAGSPVPRLPLAEVGERFVEARSHRGGPESESDYHSARGELLCSLSSRCQAVLRRVQQCCCDTQHAPVEGI